MIDDRDWLSLNAYADGELDAQAHATITARLNQEASLRRALADIRRLQRSLDPTLAVVSKPEPAGFRNLKSMNTRWLATAASIAGLAVLMTLLWPSSKTDTLVGSAALNNAWPAALHQQFEQIDAWPGVQPGARPASAPAIETVHGAVFPSLQSSGLRLVATRTEPLPPHGHVSAAHYRGERGCALTISSLPPDISETAGAESLPATLRMRRWRTGQAWYVVTARGMDPLRFDTIADYVEGFSHEQALEPLLLSMSDPDIVSRTCG